MSKEMFKLDNKVALITGAATGLGAAISIALARNGAHVAISDRPSVSLDRTAEKAGLYGHGVFRLGIDIRELSQIRKGVEGVEKEFGRIDILVNNAGINRPAPILEVTEDNWDDHFDTNAKGGFFMAQRTANGMISRGWGRIIFIASASGLVGTPGQPVYCSSKGAVIQLARTLGVEWARHGITVNAVAPTVVETDLSRERLQNPEFLRSVLDRIPAGKLATPEDVAAAVVYLASEEARMVNGAVLCVDGGWTAQ